MLEARGLPGAQDKRVDQLSGGQKQRVAIARSLVLEPTLLLLDEPLGALDLKLREHMKIELKQLQADFGTTFVYITHDQSEALVLSDHVAVMNAGRFEQVGTPQELYYRPASAVRRRFRRRQQPRRRQGGARSTPESSMLTTREGLCRSVRGRSGAIAAGDPVEAFVRPGGASIIARDANELPAAAQAFLRPRRKPALRRRELARCSSREEATRAEIRIALPQTGRFADLSVDEKIAFGFDAERAVCFAL